MAKQKKDNKMKTQEDYPDFVADVERLTVADLEKRLSNYAKENEKAEEAKENDDELNNTREKLTELAAPYRDIKKAIRMKSRYIIGLIREKGGDA